MDPPSASASNGVSSRQKRVLPSRSRRGGPGVGGCDVDIMILDTQKRKPENDPLIPANTPFILTTSLALAPSGSDPSSSSSRQVDLNNRANERYFDRPEVLKAYREQQIIQTPEFISLSDSPTVGGRFRPRGAEDNTTDTSDAAYEKRHRKYETFEKRQRLREKEKLKHEQYKLKERIEQLRGMDNAAFLALPASSFSHIPGHSNVGDDLDVLANLPGAHINGAAAYNEGERRRKEMLDIAATLEERYRVLLPPDRIRKVGPGSINNSVEPELLQISLRQASRRHTDVGESDVEEEISREPAKRDEKVKLKIRLPAGTNMSQPTSFNSSPKSAPIMPKKSRLIAPPPPPPPAPSATPPAAPLPPRKTRTKHVSPPPEPPTHIHPATNPTPPPIAVLSHPPRLITPGPSYASPDTPMSNPAIAFLEPSSPEATIVEEDQQLDDEPVGESISRVGRPRKRPKKSTTVRQAPPQAKRTSVPPIESMSTPIPVMHRRSVSRPAGNQHISYAGAAGHPERTGSALVLAATRSATSNPRATVRHLTAFGTKVPSYLGGHGDFVDYELPVWIMDEVESLRNLHGPGYDASNDDAAIEVNGNGISRGQSTDVKDLLITQDTPSLGAGVNVP